MTGFGKGECSENGKKITIELKTVNNRYLEIGTRVPKSLGFCDEIIRSEIQKRLSRGSVDVFFSFENKAEDAKEIMIDMPLAGEYVKTAKKLRTEFMLDYDYNTTALLRSPEVVKIEHAKDEPDLIVKLTQTAVKSALDEVIKMREKEGNAIKSNLADLVRCMIKSLTAITKRAPQIVTEYRSKLENRMKEILQGVEIDQARLLNEVAFFADKTDVSEEIQRLSSHFDQFVKSLESKDPQGRKLDFIAQEMNREINTIGSKCNDLTAANAVITLKNDLEKIKEQIRNVE